MGDPGVWPCTGLLKKGKFKAEKTKIIDKTNEKNAFCLNTITKDIL